MKKPFAASGNIAFTAIALLIAACGGGGSSTTTPTPTPTPSPQTISFSAPAAQTLGVTPPMLSATATSGLA
ncbi:MAG: hypothetical protein ORN28_09300, partial [Rhodoferax sp.]|nr:hypothetical protein [Rhodoferax sp.]